MKKKILFLLLALVVSIGTTWADEVPTAPTEPTYTSGKFTTVYSASGNCLGFEANDGGAIDAENHVIYNSGTQIHLAFAAAHLSEGLSKLHIDVYPAGTTFSLHAYNDATGWTCIEKTGLTANTWNRLDIDLGEFSSSLSNNSSNYTTFYIKKFQQRLILMLINFRCLLIFCVPTISLKN